MKLKTILLTVLAAALFGQMALALEPDIDGQWARDDGNARVKIAPCGENLCATNIWVSGASKGEAVGDTLVLKVKPGADKTLTGTAFDAKRDLNYSMTIVAAPDSLMTKGCIIGGLVCKTVNWSRIGK